LDVAYPVHVRIEYRERQSRSRTLLRAFTVLPHLAVLAVLELAAAVVLLIAWIAILLTGRYPRAFFGFAAGTLRYATRVGCYWMLVTDRFPPFGLGARTDGYPVEVWVDEPARLSRLTTCLRIVLAIPAWLILYFLALFSVMMSFAAWWVILVTGRLPYGMFEVMELPHRYRARASAYSWLLTDAYPWFQEEGGSEPGPWGIQLGIEPAPE
jgi:hypothetical protein